MKTWQKVKNNPLLWHKYFIREKIINFVREFFQKEKFHEVETPILVPAVIPESYLEVFETYLLDRNKKRRMMFLTASPEASLKKLLVAGIGNCYEITKSFRNGNTNSQLHNPEFTMLEWYRTKANYFTLMKDCENLILYIYRKLANKDKEEKINYEINYQKQKINLQLPWERITVARALYKYTGIDFDEITDKTNKHSIFSVEKIAPIALRRGYNVKLDNSWEEIFNQIFLNEVEPHLTSSLKPVFLYDYPQPIAALAMLKPDDNRLAERVELYIGNLELGDGYSELTDYHEQKVRFLKETANIKRKYRRTPIIDQDFLQALKIGLPQCAGMAIGLDRLVMLFTDSSSIKDILLFPLAEI